MSEVTTENVILANLLTNLEFARKALPFIKPEYFQDPVTRRIYERIFDHFQKFNEPPNYVTLSVDLENDPALTEPQTDQATETVNALRAIDPVSNLDWLLETTEGFCKEQAIYNAIQRSISIYQGEDRELTTSAIPDLLAKAISICFEKKLGMDYFKDAKERFEYYSTPENRLAMHLDSLNEASNGGPPRKTLNVLVAGVNVGKSMCLVDIAAGYMSSGLNVLYISMEMRREEVMQRIDANLLRIPVNDVASIGEERFLSRIEKIRQRTRGELIVEEYPPGSASALDFKALIDEIKMKRGFTPDVLVVDYIQIVSSYRVKMSLGSYWFYKSVAEELRGLAFLHDMVVWTAAQFNRAGMNSTDAEMSDIAESKGIADTADWMLGVIRTDELDQVGQLYMKVLKTRYGNRSKKRAFTVGVDVDQQRLMDVDQQPDLVANRNSEKSEARAVPFEAPKATTNVREKFASFVVN